MLLKALVLLNKFSASFTFVCSRRTIVYIVCLESWTLIPCFLISLGLRIRHCELSAGPRVKAASFVIGRVCTVPLYYCLQYPIVESIVLDAHSTATLPVLSFFLVTASHARFILLRDNRSRGEATSATFTYRFHLCQHILHGHLRRGRFAFPTTASSHSARSETTTTWPTMATTSRYRR